VDPDPDPDADPDPSIFIIDLKMPIKNYLKKSFSANYFLTVLLHHFLKVKSKKKSKSHKTVEIKVFLTIIA
jgi:hypothetical protein